MLLFIGDPDDLTAVYVGWLAQQRGLEVLRLPEAEFGESWWIDADDGGAAIELVAGGRRLERAQLQGAFVRFHPDPPLPADWQLSPAARELFLQERRATISEAIELLRVPAVNRPSAGRSNGAKPLHMARLERLGFAVPPWIATSDARAAAAFLHDCPDGAVVKASSGLRARVRLADDTYRDQLARGTTPSVLQRFIHGHEVRVHVVASRVFGARIDAGAVDYRFAAGDVSYRPEQVPAALAQLCVRAAAHEGLTLAGLDFRVDRAGEWWCLEMNPVPTFLPYEASAGNAIGDAVLDVLLGQQTVTREESLLGMLVRGATDGAATGARAAAAGAQLTGP